MPVLIVFLLTFIEWRDIWVSISVLVILILPSATFILVKEIKLDTREETKIEENNKEIKQSDSIIENKTLIDNEVSESNNNVNIDLSENTPEFKWFSFLWWKIYFTC